MSHSRRYAFARDPYFRVAVYAVALGICVAFFVARDSAPSKATKGPAEGSGVSVTGSASGETSTKHAQRAAQPSHDKNNRVTTDHEAPADRDILARVRAAAEDPSDQASATLLAVVDGVGADREDEAVVAQLEAIDALVARRHPAALSRIVKMTPAVEPHLGPTIIAALGALGASATGEGDRRAALDRLVSLLSEEKDRRGADSAGNVIAIIEALGVLKHPDAAPVLERELSDPFHDVAGRTSIVKSLGQIGQRSSLTPLAHLRERTIASVTPDEAGDDFTRALQRELTEAIDESIRIIKG